MNNAIVILAIEAVVVYLLVMWTHSLRTRAGLGPFYVLLGGITAVMSWVTDAGVQVEAAGITFMVGSAVFYTALLLGVFVVYVFDGPHYTRIAILTIAGVSIMVPVIAAVLHVQMQISGFPSPGNVPLPSLRINTASVLATVADLIFLAMAWEFLGKPSLRIRTWLRAFLTLLGVMWLDVFLFATGAFAGTPEYLSILQGTLLSRFLISAFAGPFLFAYLNWQNRKMGAVIENRPVLAILREVAEVRLELGVARQEIERRRLAEEQLLVAQAELERMLEEADLARQTLLQVVADQKAAEETVRTLNAELEQRVAERTRELTAAQERLIRQERLAVLGQLAGSVGHELRNPLGIIANAIYLIKASLPEGDSKTRDYLAIIEEETHLAGKIIGDLLDFARPPSAEPEPVAVSETVRRALRRNPPPDSVTTLAQIPSDLAPAMVDPRQLMQVLGNLLVNAYQAMPEGGQVTISAGQQGDMLAITVADSGVGIPPENLTTIFEPLVSTKARGVGLGLAVCASLVRANHGRIDVQSDEGSGAAFTILLPIAQVGE